MNLPTRILTEGIVVYSYRDISTLRHPCFIFIVKYENIERYAEVRSVPEGTDTAK